jgi:outer membrane protein TolC
MVYAGLAAARANLEINKSNLYPDIVLVGAVYGLWKTTDNDDPTSPYMLHPFAGYGYGGGLFIRWGLDLHLKIPRYLRARDDLAAAVQSGRAAEDGMGLEVVQAYESVIEAKRRITLINHGEKAAHSWLTAVAQNFAIGTAETRDFQDALLAYFDNHGRYLQAIFDFNVAVAQLGRVCGCELGRPGDRDVAK